MNRVFLLLLLGAARAVGTPFLICDTNPLNADTTLNVATYTITGLGTNPVTVNATTDAVGGQYLHYDLATLPNGKYANVTAVATNAFGGASLPSAPLTFTKGAPSTPTNLRISPQ
jgi:hypothetical protein